MPVVSDYTALLSGDYWAGIERTATPVFITYSFPTSAPDSHASVSGIDLNSFQAFSTTQKAQAVAALQQWASASGIVVLEVPPGQGQMNFALYDFPGASGPGSGGMAFNPFGNWNYITAAPGFTSATYIDDTGSGVLDFSGDVFINKSALSGPNFDIPTGLLLHEIGHALGLKHVNPTFPGDQSYIVNSGLRFHDEQLDLLLDNTSNTVMSYNGAEPLTLGALDIDAIQHIYGTNAQDGTHVSSYSWNSGTYELTQFGFDTTDDIMRGVSVRDLIYGDGGNDSLFGLGGNDELFGQDGNDRLFGGTGDDTLTGGAGADTFFADLFQDGPAQADEILDFNASEDIIDLQLFGSLNFTGPASVEALNLVLTDNGSGFAELSAYWNGFQQLVTVNYTGTLTAANFYMPSFGNRNFAGTAGSDLILGGLGNDTLAGGGGNDTFFGDAGTDSLSGQAGDDVFIITAATVTPGESYDGGADDDTLLVNGGGVIDVTGVTFTDIENAILTDVTGTEIIITTSQIASFTGNLDAQGADDTFVITDLAFLNTFGTPATRASIFALITDLHAGGVENVEWQEGGANNVATKIGANVVVASADPLGKTTGLSWNTSAFTFDGTTGDRLSKVTTMDDDSIVTRIFLADVVASDVTTNIAGAVDTTTVIYDGAGRADSRTITYDDGRITQYTYDNDNRVDTLMQTQSNGYSTTTSYNDSNQRTQVVSDDTFSGLYSWATSELTLDPLTGQVVEKVTILDNDNTVFESYSGGLLTERLTVDGGANESFTTSTQHFTAGVFQWQSTVYDNGTGLIQGSSAGNTISQNNGISDAIIGSGGADVFVFDTGLGADRILDFQDGLDLLNLTAMNISTLAELSSAGATLSQVGGDVVIDFANDDALTLKNFLLANLSDADFLAVV